ncbi:hypothetical protein BDZ91DRAFT_731898 [Kalaharituber pfeilii]|nr:hypothetical protein BDZ91DRAFT_731898 [Kalaharituber pfeilii]
MFECLVQLLTVLHPTYNKVSNSDCPMAAKREQNNMIIITYHRHHYQCPTVGFRTYEVEQGILNNALHAAIHCGVTLTLVNTHTKELQGCNAGRILQVISGSRLGHFLSGGFLFLSCNPACSCSPWQGIWRMYLSSQPVNIYQRVIGIVMLLLRTCIKA